MRYCFDPWPDFYDYQAYTDKSIEPPPEPLPLRYNLDNIWGNGPASGTTTTFAAAPAPAPDDATRLQRLLLSVPYYAMQGVSASFPSNGRTTNAEIFNATTIVPASYDGTFIPSSSIRTVTPPDEGTELANVSKTDTDVPGDAVISYPWSKVVGV